MSTDTSRRALRARRQKLTDQLLLQAECLTQTDKESSEYNEILNRMLRTMLMEFANKPLNDDMRKKFALHFADCSLSGDPVVELDSEDKDILILEGTFDISELQKRLLWTEAQLHVVNQP